MGLILFHFLLVLFASPVVDEQLGYFFLPDYRSTSIGVPLYGEEMIERRV